MKQWSRLLLKAEVLQWDMFPEPTDLLLIGCSIELILTPRSKSNTSTPRINLQTSWQRGISHVMSGIICCACSISAISVLQCTETMAERAQKRSGEERVTAKSRPMMNLNSRATSHVSSSWSYGRSWSTIDDKEVRSRETWYRHRPNESFRLLLSWAIHESFSLSKLPRVENWDWATKTSWRAARETRPGFSREETHHDGTHQSVVNELMLRDRRERLDIDSQEGAWPSQFVIGNDEAQIGIVSRIKIIFESGEWRGEKKRNEFQMLQKMEKNILWFGMFMTVTMESAVLMGKRYQNNCQSIAYRTDLTLKCSTHRRNWWCLSKMRSSIQRWRENHQFSAHEGLRLFGFCVVP